MGAPQQEPPAQQTDAASGAAQPERRPVICLGDSHTRGFYGASWLKLLRPQFPHLRFINAGHDGEPSECIAARLPALLEAHPEPAAIVLFSGSNDCIAQENEGLQAWYKSTFRLKQRCSEQQALDNLEGMLRLVQDKAPAAKMLVINLPVLVEDPRHSANQRAHQYSRAVCDLVTTKFAAASMVDFQTACRQHMAQHSSAWQQQQQQDASDGSSTAAPGAGAAQAQWVMTKYKVAGGMAWSKFFQSMLLGRSWNDISARQGLVLLTDQIHLNDTAAEILAVLVQPLLQGL